MTSTEPRRFPALLFFLGLLLPQPAQAGCDTAQAMYHQAMTVSTAETKAALLRASIAACPSGLAWLELGRVHLAQGSLSQAEADLGQSLKWTGLPGERGAAMAALGQVYQGMERPEEAWLALQAAGGLSSSPQVDELARSLEARLADPVWSAEVIARLLTSPHWRAWGLEPCLRLRVDRGDGGPGLGQAGRALAQVLAQALDLPALAPHSLALSGPDPALVRALADHMLASAPQLQGLVAVAAEPPTRRGKGQKTQGKPRGERLIQVRLGLR
jgi:tetratricopeptide (TPR) repeat protein